MYVFVYVVLVYVYAIHCWMSIGHNSFRRPIATHCYLKRFATFRVWWKFFESRLFHLDGLRANTGDIYLVKMLYRYTKQIFRLFSLFFRFFFSFYFSASFSLCIIKNEKYYLHRKSAIFWFITFYSIWLRFTNGERRKWKWNCWTTSLDRLPGFG